MERVPTDDRDSPIEKIRMSDVIVFVDPYEEFREKLQNRLKRDRGEITQEGQKTVDEKEGKRENETELTWFGPAIGTGVKGSAEGGVGKYLGSLKKDNVNKMEGG